MSGFLKSAVHLASQRVEELRWRGKVGDLDVVLGTGLKKPLGRAEECSDPGLHNHAEAVKRCQCCAAIFDSELTMN